MYVDIWIIVGVLIFIAILLFFLGLSINKPKYMPLRLMAGDCGDPNCVYCGKHDWPEGH